VPDPAASLVTLGQLQLQIKAGSSDNYDTQALGLLAVLVASASAIVATNGSIGTYWWAVLPSLAAAMVACVAELYVGDLDAGLPLRNAVAAYRGYTAEQINEESVRDLVGTLERVDALLSRKRLVLTLAIVFMGATAVVAIIIFTI
jgi:hypothetical protein